MKNFTFLLVILIVATMANAQNPNNLQQKIKKMQEDYSRFTQQTEHFSKAIFPLAPERFNSSLLKNALAVQKLDSVIYQEADNEDWINQWKDVYLYDSEMKNTAYIEQEWDTTSGTWIDIGKVQLDYTEDGKVNAMDIFTLDETTGTLLYLNRSVAYYNPEGRLDSVLHWYYTIDPIMNWLLEGKQIYHYSETGQLVQMDFTSLEEDEEGEYMQTMRFVYTYNDAGRMATSSIYFMDADMEFLFFETEFFYNDSGRLIASEDSVLNLLTLVVELSSRTEYEYNATDDVSVETYSSRDTATGEWIEEQKFEYTYSNTSFSEVIFPSYLQFWGVNEETNTFNNAVTEIITSLNVEGEWTTTERTQFYYSEGTTTSARDLAEARVSVYPNPASDNVTLRWDGSGLLSLEVYNITGTKVIEKQVSSGMDIQVSTFTNGVYLLKLLKDNQAIYSGKLVKR